MVNRDEAALDHSAMAGASYRWDKVAVSGEFTAGQVHDNGGAMRSVELKAEVAVAPGWRVAPGVGRGSSDLGGHADVAIAVGHLWLVRPRANRGAPMNHPKAVFEVAIAARVETRLRKAQASGGLDVRRLLALGAGRHFERDLLAFGQRLEAVHVDRAEVREQVFAAFIGVMKPKPSESLNHFTMPVAIFFKS